MTTTRMTGLALIAGAAALAGGTLLAGTVFAVGNEEPTVIELNQVACQFVEAENDVDLMYTTNSAADCKEINGATGELRLANAPVLRLTPGRYVFRVTNRNVPYDLGFWLRGDGLVARALLPGVSGGGLVMGTTKDYEIELEEGEYLYSCPLNPTPDYRLIVEG